MAISSVSFTKTPQAGDDSFSYDEDALLSSSNYNNTANILTLDVMANDLGGAAKKLWSIDNGDFQKDLLTNNVNTGWEQTSQGNMIRIVNGKIEVDLSHSIQGLGGADINSLGANDHIHDSFTYAIQLGNGTLSTATVVIDIQGMNDAASIAGTDTGTAMEDGAAAAGTLNVSDVDHGEAHSQAGSGSGANGLGSYTVDANGNWTYSADHAANDHLAAGDTATDSFTVNSLDGTAQHTVSVTIVGTNDAASISGADTGSATEDGAAAAGALSVSDVDDGEAHAQAGSGSGANGLGSYTVDANGNWTYSADHAANDHLASGATATDSFTVKSLDGTAQHTVNVTIVGTNDAASISGDNSGSLGEDDTAAVTGAVSISDVDDGEAQAQAASGNTTYGSYSVDQDGNWSYSLDNASVQSLNTGNTATDSFTIYSEDGTASKVVTITILGANEAPPPPPPGPIVMDPPPALTSNDPNDFDDRVNWPATSATEAPTKPGGGAAQGNDTLYGGTGTDAIDGLSGNDNLYGGSGNDALTGNTGNDNLFGGSGDDVITGSAGNDDIVGGYGSDNLTGSAGADDFIYRSMSDRTDTITDFSSAQGDKLVLTDLLTSIGAPHDATVFGNFVNLQSDGGSGTNVMIDMDGSAGLISPVLMVHVTNALLTQSDVTV